MMNTTMSVMNNDAQAVSTGWSNEPTMSSREIADLVNSRHDSVRRTMERLDERGVIQLTPMVEVNHKGQNVDVYHVNENHSYIVVAQLSPEFTARIVARWRELEAQVSQPQHTKIPGTFAEALRLAAEQAERIEQQAALIQLQQPKVEYHDAILSTNGAMCIRDALKSIGYKPNKASEWLRDKGYLGERNKPYQKHIEAGYYLLRQSKDKNGEIRPQTLVTAKGAQWLAKNLSMQLELRA